jgi:hypothetical protein
MASANATDVWMIEVLSDGTGQRHRRYLVAAHHREAAIAAISHFAGTELLITSSTKLEGEAAAVCELAPGSIRPI